MTFETGRRHLRRSKTILSEHTGQSLLGCRLQLLICTGTASERILWRVCCQDQPFKAYLHFCFRHMTYRRAKKEWIGAEPITQRRSWDYCQKPREKARVTTGGGGGGGVEVLLDRGKVSAWAQAKGSHSPRGIGNESLKEGWSLSWIQIPALQVVSLQISHFIPLSLSFFWKKKKWKKQCLP